MCSEHCNLPDVSFVSIDDVYSSQIAVNYLLSIGRSRIALINSQLTNAYARFREKGFLSALNKAGLQANNNWILHITEIDFDIAVSVITSLLKGPTARMQSTVSLTYMGLQPSKQFRITVYVFLRI